MAGTLLLFRAMQTHFIYDIIVLCKSEVHMDTLPENSQRSLQLLAWSGPSIS